MVLRLSDVKQPLKLSDVKEPTRLSEVRPMRLSDVQEREKGSPLEEFGRGVFRYQVETPLSALLSDIPHVGKPFRDYEPESGIEKAQFGGTRLARDLYITSKIAPLKGAALLGAAGAYGAGTAGSEDLGDIAKSAAGTAVAFKLFDVGAKYIPKALTGIYKKLPIGVQQKFGNVGRAVGTSLKKIPFVDKLKHKRNWEIKKAGLDGEKFARELEKNLSPAERTALVFMREKTGVPKSLAGSKDVIAALRDPGRREMLKHYSKEVGKRYDDYHKYLMDVYGEDVGFVENYINRLWDIPKSRRKEISNWFITRPKHLRQRFIGTIQEGINKKGLTPKTLDAAQLFREYNSHTATAMSNMRFLRGDKRFKVPGLLSYRASDGLKGIVRADNKTAIAQGWEVVDHPILRRAMGMKTKSGELMLQKLPVRVHPEIAEEMKTIFGGRIGGDFVRAVESVNAWAKHSQLTLSLFHHVALGEAALATGTFSPKQMIGVLRAMKKGEKPILNHPWAKSALKAGVNIGSPSDVQRNLVESSLLSAEENLRKGFFRKVAGKGVKSIRKAVEFNNRLLWDYYHPQLKINAYHKLLHDALKNPKYKKIPVKNVQQEVAQFVNDTFGGQNWGLMTRSPKWQQVMHWFLLSPDWNLSTVRQAMSPFQVGARDTLTKGLRAELGQNFWKASGIVMWSSINMLNRAYSQFHLGEARDMWDNDPGHKTHLFIGFNKDGSKKWLRWGKQFRELPEFAMHPIKKTAGKLSPVIQAIRQQTDPFPYGELAKSRGTSREGLERVKQIGKTFLPFSVQTQIRKGELNPIYFAFPVSGSRGGMYYNSLQNFKEALRRNDTSKVSEIHKAASENGLNADQLLRRAVGDLKYEQNKTKKKANEIFSELLTLPREQWHDHISAQDIDDKTRSRLRRLVKERLKAEALAQNPQSYSKERIEALIKR